MNALETKRLLLKSLLTDDSERIEEMAGDYDVAKSTLNIPHPYPKDSAKQFIYSIHKPEEDNKVVLFAIIKKETQELIGLINLNLADPYKRGELR